MDSLPYLRMALQHSILERKGNYSYLVSPLESIPGAIAPELIKEIVDEIIRIDAISDVDLIVCFEAMGISLGAVLSQQTGKPMSIARKKRHEFQPRVKFRCKTNYDSRTYYLYGSFAGKKILLIDDIAASGNTLKQAIDALRKQGAIVIRIVVAVARNLELEGIFQDMGVEFRALTNVQIDKDKIDIGF